METNLKLFVWEDVLSDYTSGIVFALAENEEEAKNFIIDKFKSETGFVSPRLKRDIENKSQIFTKK